jgi:deoxyxylulose-5-phosphate synthase
MENKDDDDDDDDEQEVKRILVEMLQRVMGDVRQRLTECLERNGGHLNDVIFGK